MPIATLAEQALGLVKQVKKIFLSSEQVKKKKMQESFILFL